MTNSVAIPKATLDDLAVHIIFPRKLCTKSPPQQNESLLSALMGYTIEPIAKKQSLPQSTIKLVKSLSDLHPLDNETIVSATISGLKPGEMTGLYVNQQNVCLIVYRTAADDSNDYIVSTFPGCLSIDQIHDCESDLQVRFNHFYIIHKLKSI